MLPYGIVKAKWEVDALMMKLLIELDREKILRENKYDLETIDKFLESVYEDEKMYLDKDGECMVGNFTSIGALVMVLSKAEWFLENVKRWIWYDSGFDNSENPKFGKEDLMLRYCNRASY